MSPRDLPDESGLEWNDIISTGATASRPKGPLRSGRWEGGAMGGNGNIHSLMTKAESYGGGEGERE